MTPIITKKPSCGPKFRSDAFRLIPTSEQALTDERDDGRREDLQMTINMILQLVPAVLSFTAKVQVYA